MHKTLSLLLLGALASAGVWAQQGSGHAPRGAMEREHESRGQREELRALIRQQPPPQRPEGLQGGERRPHQLSPEERQDLRNQLRQQRGENWRRTP